MICERVLAASVVLTSDIHSEPKSISSRNDFAHAAAEEPPVARSLRRARTAKLEAAGLPGGGSENNTVRTPAQEGLEIDTAAAGGGGLTCCVRFSWLTARN